MPEISYPAGRGRRCPDILPCRRQGPGPWPGVVVIHEALGLNDDIRVGRPTSSPRRGYLALAPDLYRGQVLDPVRPRRVPAAARRAGPAFSALDAAAEFLAARPDCTGQTGVIGFCLGGGFALLCAPRHGLRRRRGQLRRGAADAERMLAGACPIVASFGGRDPMGTEHPERLQRALTVLEIPHDVQVYPGSGHRFMSESSGAGADAGPGSRGCQLPARRTRRTPGGGSSRSSGEYLGG